ncbi:response regulator [Planctomycetaceae bacterium SH139]
MSVEQFSVLIVDDDDVVRKMISFAMEKEGFRSDRAVDGEEALALMKQREFDLVITDLMMPNTHGHTLATELLARPDRPLVVIHTSVVEPALAKDLMLRGVDDIVFKPTDYGAFAAKMRSWVLRRRRVKQGMTDLWQNLGMGVPGDPLGRSQS